MLQRLEYIDRNKGLAILLMVFAHTAPGEICNTFIFSFHMPIFFIICGILTAYRYGDVVEMKDVRRTLYRRIRQLGIPYLFFGFLLVVFYACLDYLSSHTFEFQDRLLALLTLQGIDSLWFIPCYFLAEILLLLSLCGHRHQMVPIFSFLTMVSIMLYFMFFPAPELSCMRVLFKVLIAYSFAGIGYCLQSYQILAIQKLPPPICILMLLPFLFLALLNEQVGIGALELKNPVLFYVNAISISILLFTILGQSQYMHLNNMLSFFGKNSIVLLCTNNLLIESIRIVDYKVFGNVLIEWDIWGCFLLWFILLAMEIPLIKLAEKTRMSVLFGK